MFRLFSSDTAYQHLLPASTIFVLSSVLPHSEQSLETTEQDGILDASEYFADPEVIRSCRAKALIETPEFKIRDDSNQMGKTRGGALRSEVCFEPPIRLQSVESISGADHTRIIPNHHQEDTTDSAYERRHRKGDALEKRVRKMEKEQLITQRQRVRDQIEYLKKAPLQELAAVLDRREQQSGSDGQSLRGAEASIGLGKQNLSAEATARHQKLEAFRIVLIRETTDVLARYDELLTEAPLTAAIDSTDKRQGKGLNAEAQGASKASLLSRSSQAGGSSSSNRSSTSEGGPRVPRLKARVGGGDKSKHDPQPTTPSPSVKAGSPGTSEVKADNSHANIHARTSGGRFAKKSQIGDMVNEAPRGKKRLEDAASPPGVSDSPSFHKPRAPRPSELARKAAREAERARAASLRGDDASPGSPSTSRVSATVGNQSSPFQASSPPYSAAAAEYEHRRRSNRTGLSLSELEAEESASPKRQKLMVRLPRRSGSDLLKRPDGENSTESPPRNRDQGNKATPQHQQQQQQQPRRSSPMNDPTRQKFSAPGELSMEQAQQMMMERMMQMSKAGGGPSLPLNTTLGNVNGLQHQASSSSIAPSKGSQVDGATSSTAKQASPPPPPPPPPSKMIAGDVEMSVEAAPTESDAPNPIKKEEKDECKMDFQMASQSEDDQEAKMEPLSSGPDQGTPLTGATGSSPAPEAGPSDTSIEQGGSPSKNRYEPHSSSPSYAYLPGRSAAARERAGANIPLRRASGRVAEQAKGAFGEKVPLRASHREDFDRAMMQARYEWSGTVVEQVAVAVEPSRAAGAGAEGEETDLEDGSGSYEDAIITADSSIVPGEVSTDEGSDEPARSTIKAEPREDASMSG